MEKIEKTYSVKVDVKFDNVLTIETEKDKTEEKNIELVKKLAKEDFMNQFGINLQDEEIVSIEEMDNN